jgi:hypothetical protein
MICIQKIKLSYAFIRQNFILIRIFYMSTNHSFLLPCLSISVKTIEMHIQSHTQSRILCMRKQTPEYTHTHISVDNLATVIVIDTCKVHFKIR